MFWWGQAKLAWSESRQKATSPSISLVIEGLASSALAWKVDGRSTGREELEGYCSPPNMHYNAYIMPIQGEG